MHEVQHGGAEDGAEARHPEHRDGAAQAAEMPQRQRAPEVQEVQGAHGGAEPREASQAVGAPELYLAPQTRCIEGRREVSKSASHTLYTTVSNKYRLHPV